VVLANLFSCKKTQFSFSSTDAESVALSTTGIYKVVMTERKLTARAVAKGLAIQIESSQHSQEKIVLATVE